MPDVVRRMTPQIRKFAQISKVDAVHRQVFGTMIVEQPDKSGEIFDYKTSKPFFEKWAESYAEVTKGKSKGNVREMHQLSAVGKVIDINFDDDSKKIDIGVEIVDEDAWRKVEKGVYTGFSIGGKLVGKKTKTEEGVRYTVSPIEVSVVDDPCVPDATFEYMKAENQTELRKFAPVKKSMADVCDMAALLAGIKSLLFWVETEAVMEDDGSKVPAAMQSWLKQGVELLQALCAEESSELIEAKVNDAALLKVLVGHAQKNFDVLTALLNSAEQNLNSGADDMDINKINEVVGTEITKAMQPFQDVLKSLANVDLSKLAGLPDQITKLQGSIDDIKKVAEDAQEIASETAKTVAHIAGQPEEPVVAASAHAVSKTEDLAGTVAAETDASKAKTAGEALKISLGQPKSAAPFLK